MKFGTRLSYLLEMEQISQQQLSQELNISPSTLNGYLKNRRQPDYKTLQRVAAYFGTSTDYLLGMTSVRESPAGSLSSEESHLVDMYRLMTDTGQSMMMDEAHLIWRHNKKHGEDTDRFKS